MKPGAVIWFTFNAYLTTVPFYYIFYEVEASTGSI